MKRLRELHFQEGFAGQEVVVLVDGRERCRFRVSTRLQTGLARIEAIELDDGVEVAVAVPSLALRQSVGVQQGHRWLTVNLEGGQLLVKPVAAMPGYV